MCPVARRPCIFSSTGVICVLCTGHHPWTINTIRVHLVLQKYHRICCTIPGTCFLQFWPETVVPTYIPVMTYPVTVRPDDQMLILLYAAVILPFFVQPVACESDATCQQGEICGVHPQRWADGSYRGGVEQGSCGTHVAWVSLVVTTNFIYCK